MATAGWSVSIQLKKKKKQLILGGGGGGGLIRSLHANSALPRNPMQIWHFLLTQEMLDACLVSWVIPPD